MISIVCGIIGYIGDKQALPFLLSGLKNLEYRGYDSCGVALIEGDKLRLVKTKGEVDNLVSLAQNLRSRATVGIGHTRWATHGKPSKVNAHPHLDCTGRLAVIHNGIIENFEALKEELIGKGHKFVSQTDTEVLAHLIEEYLKQKKSLFWATGEALKRVVGAYGVAVVSADFPDEIVVGRLSSPLLLGLGKKRNYLASDQPALISWTKQLATLQDGQLARISHDGVKIRNLDGQAGRYQRIKVEQESREVSKGKFPHFMLKEIFEQPRVVEDGLRGRFSSRKGVVLGGIQPVLDQFEKAEVLPIVACGTSYYAALTAKFFFQKIAGLPIMIENATELVATGFPWRENQPAIFASQSGETADILTVLREAKKAGVSAFGLVNVAGSSLARETEAGVYIRAGFEVGVAASKTFTAQMLAFLLWSLLVAKKRGKRLSLESARFKKELAELPALIKRTLRQDKEIRRLATSLKKASKIYFLGRGLGFAIALETALKVKELAYIPAEGMAAGELKHGPLALVDKETILFFLVPDGSDFKKNVNSIHEAAARGGRIIVLTNKKDQAWSKIKAEMHYFPKTHSFLSVFPMAVWAQLLAYYLAYYLGRSIDKPRNLAKSVTVE